MSGVLGCCSPCVVTSSWLPPSPPSAAGGCFAWFLGIACVQLRRPLALFCIWDAGSALLSHHECRLQRRHRWVAHLRCLKCGWESACDNKPRASSSTTTLNLLRGGNKTAAKMSRLQREPAETQLRAQLPAQPQAGHEYETASRVLG